MGEIVDIYIVVYLMSNALVTFALERFMRVFFEKKRTSLLVSCVPYALYFGTSSFVFLQIGIPIVTLFTGISTIFIISLMYVSSFVKRLTATICIFLFAAVAEVLAFLATGSTLASHFAISENRDLVGFISWGLLVYLLALILQRFKNIRRGAKMQPLHWVITTYIPVASVFIIALLLISHELPNNTILLAVAAIFGINLLAFYLYDALATAYDERLRSKLYEQEKEHYLAQCQMMQDSVEKMKAFKHDVKLHFGALKGMVNKDEIEQASHYLSTLSEYVHGADVYSQTGNLGFDSIINYKLRDASEKKITLTMDLIPISKTINIEIIDITTILGNLLDNALDALEKVEDKWIKLKMRYGKGRFVITVSNPFDGNLNLMQTPAQCDDNNPLTTKSGSGHGYGIKNIKLAANKYGGEVIISHDDNVFCVTVLLLLE